MIPSIDVPASSSIINLPSDHIKETSQSGRGAASTGNTYTENELIDSYNDNMVDGDDISLIPKLIEKSVIIHKDENGFGLRIKGQSPVFVEHVHENGAAWRAGVRPYDTISKVNGAPVRQMDHKDVVLMFKGCTRIVGLTLLSQVSAGAADTNPIMTRSFSRHSRQPSTYSSSGIGAGFIVTSSTRSSHLSSNELPLVVLNNRHRHQPGSVRSMEIRQKVACRGSAAETGSHLFLPIHQSYESSQSCGTLAANGAAGSMDSPLSCRSLAEAGLLNRQAPVGADRRLRATTVGLAGHTSSRRDSLTGHSLGDDEQANRSDKRMAICVSCRSLIDTTTTTTTTSLSPYSNDSQSQLVKGVTCSQCCQLTASQLGDRVRLSSSSARGQLAGVTDDKLNSSRAGRQPASATRQRVYGSLRDPPKSLQQQQHEDGADGGGNTHLSHEHLRTNQNQKQLTDQLTGGLGPLHNRPPTAHSTTTNNANFKLNQSPSAYSLPSEAARQQQQQQQQQVAGKKVQLNRQPTTNKRLEIIRELIDTERTHTERLRCLDELFYRPLKAGSLMTNEQLRMVFSCHRTLYKIHRQIYRILLSVSNYNLYTEPMIGSALLEIFEGDLKRRLERAACSFCSAQATNVELLNKLTRRDTKVGEFLAQVTSQRMVGRLGIKDLLASCFQRLTKYPLLLENLLKATPQTPQEQDSQGEEDDRSAAGLVADDDDDDNDDDDNNLIDSEDNYERQLRRQQQSQVNEEARRNSRRMLAIGLAEEREFIERALLQSRQILVRVNETVRVAVSHNKLKEIWKRTDKYPGVPLIDITNQQVVHEGLLTLRLSKRSFDVYVLLLNDYIIILTREGQDKYRLKFFTPEGKSSSLSSSVTSGASGGTGTNQHHHHPQQNVYSPVFVIDEHLTTRDAATDENGFYLLCKRKDDSRIYEFASRSPAERMKWRDKIQWTIERQMSRNDRRPSSESTITKSSSDISAKRGETEEPAEIELTTNNSPAALRKDSNTQPPASCHQHGPDPAASAKQHPEEPQQKNDSAQKALASSESGNQTSPPCEPTKIVGTISYVEEDEIVEPSELETSRALVEQAIQVNVFDSSIRTPTVSSIN